jgi:hypothetical protein
VLRAPRVSQLTLCPLGQPEKAIGHESLIEPWLTLTTTLLDASETDERRYASKMNLENRENHGSSYQYMGWMSETLRLPVAGGVFFLDIPFYRTMLHALWRSETIRQPQAIQHAMGDVMLDRRAEAEKSPRFDARVVLAAIAQLKALIESSDGDAAEAFLAVEDALAGTCDKPRLSALGVAIREFDFDSARKKLDEIAKEYGANWEQSK